MKFRLFLLLLFIFFNSLNSSGQTKVSGRIEDAKSGEQLIGANIFSPNTKQGTISDYDGFFELVTFDSVLIITYTGYTELKVKIDSSFLNIQLNPGLFLSEAIVSVDGVSSRPAHKIHPAIAYLYKQDIQQNNETSIAPVLNTIPGVLMHSGALNTNRITIRGIGNRNLFGTAKIKAFLDGIPLTNGSGETVIEDIDLSMVDAVTVYKGPASSIYGAGLGGMISLQLPDNIYKNGNTISLKSTGGSYGLGRQTLNISRANYNKSLINVNLNNTHSEGYRQNSEYTRQAASGFGKFQISETEEISMLINYTYLNSRIPSSLDSTDYVDNPQNAAFIWARARGAETTKKAFVGLSYKASIGNHFSQVSSIHGTFRNSYETRPFNILRENSMIIGARTEWIYQNSDGYNFLSNFEFHLGAELFDEDYNWQTYDTNGQGSREDINSDNNEKRYYTNIFAQIEADIDFNTSITLGINRNFTRYNFSDYYRRIGNQGSYRAFPSTWSPFINIGLRLSEFFLWDNDLSLSATVSHGFSPPTLEESFSANGRINPDILPEQGWNYELGIRGSIKGDFDYAISFYSMQIKDLLVAQRTDFDEYIGINAGKTSHNGIEVALNYNIHFKSNYLVPFLNYTYADYTFKEFIDEDEDHSGNQLTGTAPHLLNTGIKWASNKWYGNIIYRFVDAMPMRDDNSIYSEAYQLVNLKLGSKFTIEKKWHFDFFAGINNLFNEKYASMVLINAGSFGGSAPRYYYPGLPRNFYVGIKVGFGE
ncbi:MAG: iron complex outermembrane receptor protein [Saprospiraceae bacterium]|jgi:iron complex outermembrane receptor protein